MLGKTSGTLSSSSSSTSSSSLPSSSSSSSGPSGSHDHSLSDHCPPLNSTSCHWDPAAPNLRTPAPSYQHGLSFVVKAPHGINSALPSTDPHPLASSKPALSSSANCVAPMLPNNIPSVLDHQKHSSARSTLSLLELPSATSFYDPSRISVTHEPGSTFANKNNSSLPKSTESDMRNSTVKINLKRELPYEIPSHILMRIQEMDSKFISLGLGGDCWPKSYSHRRTVCVMWY